jgi:DnaK suppressor protein
MAEKKKKSATTDRRSKTARTTIKKDMLTSPPRGKGLEESRVEKESMSSAEIQSDLRRSLLATRAQILREAKTEISKYIKGETRQLVDTALDDGDWSVVDLTEDISLRQLSAHRNKLQKIDAALRKLDEGTYGICEDCGEEISKERLRIVPFAIYCIEDQERREKLEALQKKEDLR